MDGDFEGQITRTPRSMGGGLMHSLNWAGTWLSPARWALAFGLILLALTPPRPSTAASAHHPLTVKQALSVCVDARRRHRGAFQLIVASPRTSVHGFFVQVIWNGYPVAGESGALYQSRIPLHGKRETIMPNGGLGLGLPSARIRRRVANGVWGTATGMLRCYAPMGQILMAVSWRQGSR